MTARPGSCHRRGCDNPATRILTFGRGPRARTRAYCDECAADAHTLFGTDVTADRPLEQA